MFWENLAEYEFEDAVEKLAERVKEKSSGKITLFVTPYPHNGIGNFFGGKDYTDSTRHDTDKLNFNGHNIRDYVDVLEEIAVKYGIPVLNLHNISGFYWRVHTSDGCHPNTEGHKWLAEQIEKAIRKLL